MGQTFKHLAFDYSNIKDWTGDLVSNMDLIRDKKTVLLEFQIAVVEIDVDFEINALEKLVVTLKKPNQKLIGVSLAENNCLQEREEKMTKHVTNVQDEADLLAELITPRASPCDCMVEMVYKSNFT